MCIVSVLQTWLHEKIKALLCHMTMSAEKQHYGRLSREDSGGRKREEGSMLTLRCIISKDKTGNTT